MGLSTSFLRSTRRTSGDAMVGEGQLLRCASFSGYHAYRLLSKHGPRATVRPPCPSTSSMMIPFFIYFIFINRFFWAKTRMTRPVSSEGAGNGSTDNGGISLPTFANDGETSYLDRHRTWVFILSVQMARPLQTCSHIRLPFHSSSITSTASPQKTRRECSLL